MRFIGRATAVTTALVAALTAAPASADVNPGARETPQRIGTQARDGKLHVYVHANYKDHCAAWSGNSTYWGGCNDRVSSLVNRGYPGNLDDVWVYQHADYGGHGRGIHNGVGIANLANYNYDGTLISLNDSISSHRWVNLP